MTSILAAIHDLIFSPSTPPAAAAGQAARPAEQPVNLDDQALLDLAERAANGPKFVALWHGETSAHGGDHSAADQALCNHLAFYTGNDAARIDSLFSTTLSV